MLQCEHISLHVVRGINSLLHFKNISTSSGASSLEVRGATTWTGQGYKGSGKEFLAPVFSKKIRIDKEDVPKNLPEKIVEEQTKLLSLFFGEPQLFVPSGTGDYANCPLPSPDHSFLWKGLHGRFVLEDNTNALVVVLPFSLENTMLDQCEATFHTASNQLCLK